MRRPPVGAWGRRPPQRPSAALVTITGQQTRSTVVRSNDKKRGRLEAMRFVLSRLDYPDKDPAVAVAPDPLIVGPPDAVAADAGEGPAGGRW